MGYGFGGHIGIQKETAWGSGTAVSSGNYVEAMSEDISVTMERFPYKAIIGALAEPDDTVGLRRVEGSIQFAAHPISLGHFLKGVLGSTSVVNVTSGFTWNHRFFSTAAGSDFSADVPLQPYTIEVDRDVTSSFQYAGCVIDALSMMFEPNNAIMCEARVIGRGSSVIQATTPTFPGSPAKPFTFDTVSLSVGGSGTSLIESLTVEINNNLEGIGALNLSTDIAKVRRSDHQMVNISGTLDFTDITEYQKFINQTEQRFLLHVTKASSFSLTIDMPRVVYTAFPTGIPGRERITVDFEGKAFYHSGSGTAIQIDLVTTANSSYFT